ncbi:RNA-binding protein 44 isoform X2 [Osmerus eperlanus]|uniref:RNA-binding protein 44 isoform X2 n=1 Tax=Osmerus eperlanus TaxID=29151 RepID=UPI002E0D5634
MWFPVPLLLPLPQTSPYALQPSGMSYGSGSFQLQMIPFDRHSFPNDGRQFLLNRSLFDLVKVTNILELTDAKLLGWYLALPVEDQKLIQEAGGFLQFLHRHPALEVTKQFVYVKRTDPAAESYRPPQTMSVNLNKSRRPTFYGVTECLNCGTSCPSGGQRCRRCTAPFQMGMDSGDQDTELKNGQKMLNDLLNCAEGSAVGSQKSHWGSTGSPCPLEPISKDNHLQTLQESFQSACDVSSQVLEEPPSHQEAHCSIDPTQHQLWEEGAKQDDPSAQANFSLDMELEMCSQKGATGCLGGPCAEAEYPTIAHETPPEYSSFNSTRLDRTEWNNSSQSAEAEGDDSLLANRGSAEEPLEGVSVASSCPLEEKEHYLNKSCNCTYDVEDSPGDRGRRDEALRCQQENEEEEDFHSIMEEDKSILLCQTSERIHLVNSANAPVSPSQAAVTSVAAFNFPRSPHKASMIDGSTNTLPPVSTHDICVGPNSSLAGCQQHIQTQTQGPTTADRSVNTEVYMADLDFLAKEFRKLKVAEEDLQELKRKMERSAGAGREGESGCGCNSAQRARRAELCLVALQYGMCQQHCWRRYYTSPEGDRLVQGVEVPPENLMEVLKVLEADYREMREKILAGIPLDQLKPLAVDSQKITSATCYIPAQIIGETLESASSRVSERSSQQMAGAGDVRPPTSTGEGSQTGERGRGPVCLPKFGSNKTGKAVILLPQPTGIHHGRKPGGGKELNSSEAWYDAEEDLGPAGATAKANTQTAEADDGGAVQGQDAYLSSLLCVTQFPSDVTEGDLMLLFEKYQASEVSISTFRNNLKAAIVTISGPNFAEAAVGEMNGHIIQGRRLHVEHIQKPNSGASDENQSLGTATQPQSSSATPRPQPSGDNHRPQSSSESQCTTTYVKPFRPSLEKRTVVCDSPTASGTCVPQHYATMGSFDTLMSRLTAHHPEAGRQRIVDALLELRAKHQGYLSGLPLSMIVDMTSDLLTKSKIMKG